MEMTLVWLQFGTQHRNEFQDPDGGSRSIHRWAKLRDELGSKEGTPLGAKKGDDPGFAD